MLQKIAAKTNSIEWRYETDTCSVSHGKSHGSCNVKCSGECVVCAFVNKLRKKRQLAAYFDKKQCAVERIESHKLLANFFSAIGLDFDKNFGKRSSCLGHCYLLRIQYKHDNFS